MLTWYYVSIVPWQVMFFVVVVFDKNSMFWLFFGIRGSVANYEKKHMIHCWFCGIVIMAGYNPHFTIWLGRISSHINTANHQGPQLATAQHYRIIILHNIQTSLVATKTLRICMKLYHVFGLYRWYNLFTSRRIPPEVWCLDGNNF